MAENTPTNAGAVDKNGASERLEQQKKEALGSALTHCIAFIAADVKIVQSLEQLLAALVVEVQKDPSVVFSGGGGDIDALVNALKAKPEGGLSRPGVSGTDIVGGFSWSDIVDTIKALQGFIESEKPFIMEIIRLIFCGCKGTGW